MKSTEMRVAKIGYFWFLENGLSEARRGATREECGGYVEEAIVWSSAILI
jgi:hypothetical protein